MLNISINSIIDLCPFSLAGHWVSAVVWKQIPLCLSYTQEKNIKIFAFSGLSFEYIDNSEYIANKQKHA